MHYIIESEGNSGYTGHTCYNYTGYTAYTGLEIQPTVTLVRVSAQSVKAFM